MRAGRLEPADDRVAPDQVEGQQVDDEESGVTGLAGEVRTVSTDGWPEGYVYGATRYAGVILRQSFPERFADLVAALAVFGPTLAELRAGGGGRTVFVKRFDDSLAEMVARGGARVWGKQNVTIEKSVSLDGTEMVRSRTRGHEIDMFGRGHLDVPVPGIAVEMGWNKDPFFDRDLVNLQALHHEGAIAIGVIVTRGPRLQNLIGPTIRSKDGGFEYGRSTTHWSKLVPVDLGGGGECPMLLIGIEPERVQGIELAQQVLEKLQEAQRFKERWGERYDWWTRKAKPVHRRMLEEALVLMPPLRETRTGSEEA